MNRLKKCQQTPMRKMQANFSLSDSTLSALAQKPLARQNLLFLGVFLLLCVLALLPDMAHASTGTAGGLPYEDFLTKLRASMSGPVAFTLSLIGVIASGAALIFGGDLNGFFRSMIFLVLVVAIIIAANSLMQGFFGGAELSAFIQPLPSALTAMG